MTLLIMTARSLSWSIVSRIYDPFMDLVLATHDFSDATRKELVIAGDCGGITLYALEPAMAREVAEALRQTATQIVRGEAKPFTHLANPEGIAQSFVELVALLDDFLEPLPPLSAADGSAMAVDGCMPVIPSADLERSLRFWVDGLGLTMDRPMHRDGRLIGCMVGNARVGFWLNQRAGDPRKPADYEGIRLYWAPSDLRAVRERLLGLGFAVSEVTDRDYGQTEFFVTDDDGYEHCFGVATGVTATLRSLGS